MCWYQDAPVGVHNLQQTVKWLCDQAGLKGHFTNHSLRATAATRLYNAGIDEQLIAEKTGHRSTAIRAYKRTNDEQQAQISNILNREDIKMPKVESNESTKREGTTELTIEAGSVKINVKYWLWRTLQDSNANFSHSILISLLKVPFDKYAFKIFIVAKFGGLL